MSGGAAAEQRELRVIAFGDLHLDRSFPWTTSENGAAARAAQAIAFEAICAVAGAEGDVLISAGDLFDQDRHHPDTGEMLRAGFERLAPMPVLLVPGESDPPDRAGLYEQVKWTSNVHVCRTAGLVEPIPGLTVWVVPPGSEEPMPPPNPGEIRIVVLRDGSPELLAELESREDVHHVISAGSHFPSEEGKSSAPGAAHPAEPHDPDGSLEVLSIADDGTVGVSRRQLGGKAPAVPGPRFATDELDAIDLAVIGEEQTVRGEFVRNLLAPDETPTHVRRLALLSGMRALMGRPPSDVEP